MAYLQDSVYNPGHLGVIRLDRSELLRVPEWLDGV